VRTRSEEISSQGRATQGVRLIKLKVGESLVGVARVEEPEVDPDAVTSEVDTQDDGEQDMPSAE